MTKSGGVKSFLGGALLLTAGACATFAHEVPRDDGPAAGPEATCTKRCTSAGLCSTQACTRGCNLVLDRLVEHEGDRVLACVAEAGHGCNDRAWARCAARVGPHADGGPPPPSAASDETEE